MSMVVAGCVGAATAIVSGIISNGKAKKARRRAEKEAKARAAELANLERSRQAIINPYEGVKDVSSMASNPFASLGVATQAADIQIEEADISLANTLDTLRATGSSAGGATALAQAALQSKRGVAASIEQQEANNEKLKAEGQAQMQKARLDEAQRIQGVQFGEAQRMQQADIEGTKFKFGEQESRDISRLNRLSGQQAQSQANQAAAKQAQNSAYGSIASSVGSIGAGALAGGYAG